MTVPKKTPMLSAWELCCPVCGAAGEVRQVGHFVSTLIFVCGAGHISNFIGPTIPKWEDV